MLKKIFLNKYISLVFILCITVVIRFYKIDTPLWLDEIYGYRLAKLGFTAILQNSWQDLHPPLFYLLQWVVSGFGSNQTEICWRFVSLLSGTCTILVFGKLLLDLTDPFTSTVTCLIMSTLPSMVYYSQEARSFALLILLSSLSIWAIIKILKTPEKLSIWIIWIVVTIAGLLTGYNYLLLATVQFAFLGFYYYRRPILWIAFFSFTSCLAILFPFMANNLLVEASRHAKSEPLTFWRTLQSIFAGEPLRYGFSAAHIVFPFLILGFCLLGSIKMLTSEKKLGKYLLSQIILTLGIFFIVSPFIGLHLPLYEAKQFIILMPVFCILIAEGFSKLRQWTGNKFGFALIILVMGFMVISNGINLRTYWENPKSPEGLAVLKFRNEWQIGESVVSLHYSINTALGFYAADIPIYLNPEKNGNQFMYQVVNSSNIFDPSLISSNRISADEIRQKGEFWILAHASNYRESLPALINECQIIKEEYFAVLNGSFEIMKVNCQRDT